MINRIDFISREAFERFPPRSDTLAISIGDHGQAVPAMLGAYGDRAQRTTFLDLTPEVCEGDKTMLFKCFHTGHAKDLAEFIRRWHATPEKWHLLVHCEMGISRSAAVAQVAAAFSGVNELKQDFQYANLYVLTLLSRALEITPEQLDAVRFRDPLA